jgi:hypothetical protein
MLGRVSAAASRWEGLRMVFRMPYKAAVSALDRWIAWARRCRIPAFVKLQKSIAKHCARILAAIEHNLPNGLIESTNTKIRLITRMAYGFQLRRRPDRPRHAQPRRLPPRPSRPELTHRCVRRARKGVNFRAALTRPDRGPRRRPRHRPPLPLGRIDCAARHDEPGRRVHHRDHRGAGAPTRYPMNDPTHTARATIDTTPGTLRVAARWRSSSGWSPGEMKRCLRCIRVRPEQ